MCRMDRNPIFCFVPPHIMRALAESKDRRVREMALRTLGASSRIRGRREVLAKVRPALVGAPAGQKHRIIYDARNDVDLPGHQVRVEGGAPSQDPAVNQAYDGLGATYDLFKDVYGRNSIDGMGMRLIATVHFDEGFNNAFWDGEQMVFGDGDGIIFTGFTNSIDVMGHELTHGVIQYTAALEYKFQSGALNESFSDVFGSLVKQYLHDEDAASADWLVGKGLLGPGINGRALRSLKEPGSAYDDPKLGGKDPQPGRMDDFVQLPLSTDRGGVHINSGIPNRAFYLVATQLGGHAWEEAGAIWYKALFQLWPEAQFQDCANVTAQIASADYGPNSAQHRAVLEAWDEVGLPVDTPQPVASRRAGKPVPVGTNGTQLKRQLARLSAELQRTVEAIS